MQNCYDMMEMKMAHNGICCVSMCNIQFCDASEQRSTLDGQWEISCNIIRESARVVFGTSQTRAHVVPG